MERGFLQADNGIRTREFTKKDTGKFIQAFLFCSILTLFYGGIVFAQPAEYPALTRVISYDGLCRRQIIRTLEWIDPDGTAERMKIIEMAIPVDERMKAMTREFVRVNYGRDSIWVRPRVILFHAMGDGDLKKSLEVSSFLNDRIPETWGELHKAGDLPNGAHFIIDKDGTIICLTPPTSRNDSQISFDRDDHRWLVKRHQDANPIAIGIENVTDRDNWTMLTDAQVESNAKLARWLIWMERGRLDYSMSHHQFNDDANYDRFLKAFQLVYLQKAYRTRGRKDIGDKTLREIAVRINQYGITTHYFFNPR